MVSAEHSPSGLPGLTGLQGFPGPLLAGSESVEAQERVLLMMLFFELKCGYLQRRASFWCTAQ